MNIFITGGVDKSTRRHFVFNGLQCSENRISFIVGQNADVRKPFHMSPRTIDVVKPQTLVKRQAGRIRHELIGGPTSESAMPQCF